jgi:tetraacyldisaccharide 4'-kinase
MNPLSAIFGAGVALRNALYDHGVFKVKRLSRPVVSIGNITVGGSGKTPLVIALGELLKARGIEFDVLSRGYGRKGVGVAIVDPCGSPEQFGDEPLLIARKLRAPVIVGSDRYQAGLLAEEKFASRLHLLDDGFQHRGLHRDFDIVILSADDLRDTLLPVGRLREPVSSCRRAGAVVNFDDATFDEATFDGATFPSKPIWAGHRQVTLPATKGKMIAFCGIARPGQFFAQLREAGGQVAETVAFPDHHRYTERDVSRLLRLKSSAEADGFITTEKDTINLGALCSRLQPLHCAQLDIVLRDPDEALSAILGILSG